MFSFGLIIDNIQVGQMAKTVERLSTDLLAGLISLGLYEEDQDTDVLSVIDRAAVGYSFDIITVDPDNTPNTRDEFFINAVSECVFHSDENIPNETCVICELTSDNETPLGNGRFDLPEGYTASQSIPVKISELEFEGANDVTNVHGVTLQVCDSGNGCTPGFWRNHLGAMEQTGIAPDVKFKKVFGLLDSDNVPIKIKKIRTSDPTFEQAVNAEGGGMNALTRHAASALLNSLSAIDYPLTSEQVILAFYDAYSSKNYEETTNLFAELNEIGCPIDNEFEEKEK